MDKTGSMFETCKEVMASIASEKCLNVVHEGYWVFISGFLLWYEGDSDFFGWAWYDAKDEGKVDNTLRKM